MAECYTFAEKTGASREIMAWFFDRCFAHPGLKSYARRLLDRNIDGVGGFSMRGGLRKGLEGRFGVDRKRSRIWKCSYGYARFQVAGPIHRRCDPTGK
jgi:hypothetical protein